jgi:flavin-dependent dehydrogenase
MEDIYDIVVVGAGPAGCSFLHHLQKDYKVLLIDQQKMPATKICGGLLTEEAIDFLARQNLEIPNYAFSKPKKLKKIYVNVDKNKEKESGEVYNIDRNNFNKWMFNLIKNKVDVSEMTLLQKVCPSQKNITLTLYDKVHKKNTKVSCKYLVGADGVLSRVRKELRVIRANKYLAIQEYGTSEQTLDRLLFFFSKAFIDHFIWAIPKKDSIVIGLPFHYDPGTALDLRKLDAAKKIIEKQMDTKIQVHYLNGFLVSILQSADELCLGKENILLLGEAAGWVSPRSGDGISFALRSGYECAQAFNENADSVLSTYTKNTTVLKIEFDEKLASFLKIQQKINELKKMTGKI